MVTDTQAQEAFKALQEVLIDVRKELVETFPDVVKEDQGEIIGYSVDEDTEIETGFYVVDDATVYVFRMESEDATLAKLDSESLDRLSNLT